MKTTEAEGSGPALFGGPVSNLSALQHRPPMSLEIVDQGNEDRSTQEQLEKTKTAENEN